MEIDGPRPPLRATAAFTHALRGTLLAHADDPPPPELSGHAPSGAPLAAPHAAFLAIPDPPERHVAALVVAYDAACAAAVEPAIETWRRRARARDRPCRLTAGRHGVARVVPRDPTAAPAPWTNIATAWQTVTPIALDRHPRDLDAEDAGRRARAFAAVVETIAVACDRAVGVRPSRVRWTRGRGHTAVAARTYPSFPLSPRHGPKRILVHAILEFPVPVTGPLVLGAGRYFGLGLLRPVS